METKTVNADTKFITRDITQQVGKHTKIICLVQMIEGREAHFMPTHCCFAEITPTLFHCSHRHEGTGRAVVGTLGNQEKTRIRETWSQRNLSGPY